MKRHSSEIFFVSVSLLRQLMMAALFFVFQGLCFLAHLGGDSTASGTRYNCIWDEIQPHLGRDTTASGSRNERIWDEIQPHLGRETNASGRRYERVWGEIRSHLGRRSLTNIEIDLLGTLHHVSLGVAISLTRCSGFIPISPWLLARLS